MNKKKIIFIIIGILIIIFFSLLLINNKKNKNESSLNNNKSEMILFYSDTCSHCKKVTTFIKKNHIKDSIKFQELEVGNNKKNAQLLMKEALICNLDLNNGVGVPFFFTGKDCLVGDDVIINYLKNK